MICLDIDTEHLTLKGKPRVNGSYLGYQVRYEPTLRSQTASTLALDPGRGRADYLDIIIPKMVIPYNPKDTKNAQGETFLREFNLKADCTNDANGRHIREFIKKIEDIREKLSKLTGIPLRDPFFRNEISGTLFTVKIKTKFGTTDFNIEFFDKDGKYCEEFDTSKLKNHTVSGKLRVERIWAKKDKSSGGIDFSFVQLRDYGG